MPSIRVPKVVEATAGPGLDDDGEPVVLLMLDVVNHDGTPAPQIKLGLTEAGALSLGGLIVDAVLRGQADRS